eukprot:8724518-Pyramimonas_sp.AAC.1
MQSTARTWPGSKNVKTSTVCNSNKVGKWFAAFQLESSEQLSSDMDSDTGMGPFSFSTHPAMWKLLCMIVNARNATMGSVNQCFMQP